MHQKCIKIDKCVNIPTPHMQGLHNVEHVVEHMRGLREVLTVAEREGRDTKKYLSNYVFVGGPGSFFF